MITEELARRLIDSQFPCWSILPIHPVARQGVDNRSYRLGDDLLVRLPAGQVVYHLIAKELTWLEVADPPSLRHHS